MGNYINADDISNEFKLFIDPLRLQILNDPLILNNLFDIERNSSEEIKLDNLILLVDEADETLRMISVYLKEGQVLLEVGGGIGLVYGFLKQKGFQVVSLEPSSGGFGDRNMSGKNILQIAKINDHNWLKCRIQNLDLPECRFDFIFSNFVLEHIPELSESFEKMGTLLKDDGVMVHRCPNYDIPFENHFNIPLFPFFPKFTENFYPKLRGDALWEELHFTNTREIRKICGKHKLKVSFQRGMFSWAFRRIFTSPIFRSRKKRFALLANWLNSTGLIKILDIILCGLSTPMTFEVIRSNK